MGKLLIMFGRLHVLTEEKCHYESCVIVADKMLCVYKTDVEMHRSIVLAL